MKRILSSNFDIVTKFMTVYLKFNIFIDLAIFIVLYLYVIRKIENSN
jgi:hypothetical protein